MDVSMLYQMPTLVIGMLFIVILLGALETGYRIGLRRGQKMSEPLGKGEWNLVLTSMYSLLSLMLAFTYTFTLSRADLRKQAVIDEANAIGTAFLRAGMAPEPTRLATAVSACSAPVSRPGSTRFSPELPSGR